jgi:hypothetical protein
MLLCEILLLELYKYIYENVVIYIFANYLRLE